MRQKRHFPDRDDENEGGAGSVAVRSENSKNELRQKRHFYDSDTEPRKKARADVENTTYHNCKIVNIVSHGKKIGKCTKQQIMDWFNDSDTGSDSDTTIPHKNTAQLENLSDPEFDKALSCIDLTQIEEDYWRSKQNQVTPQRVQAVRIPVEKRTPPKNPYKK